MEKIKVVALMCLIQGNEKPFPLAAFIGNSLEKCTQAALVEKDRLSGENTNIYEVREILVVESV